MNTGGEIPLKANDSDDIVKIDEKSASRSELINDLKADYGDGEMSMQEVGIKALKIIVEYLQHYREAQPKRIEAPIPEDKELKDLTDPWDIEYIAKLDFDTMTDVISGAEFMRIEPLHKLISAYIACQIRNLDAPGIIKYFNIEEDMTEEEMNKMEEEDNEQLMKELAEEEEKEKKRWEDENKGK